MNEEKMKILKMVEEGKITAEQALELMESMNIDSSSEIQSKSIKKGKFLKIKVFDINRNKYNVNLNIPISLVEVGLKLGMKFGLEKYDVEGLNYNDIISAIQSGTEGKLIDVIDEDKGEKVEIYIE